MTNRVHDSWTEEETQKLKRYMKREGIKTELHCDAEGWEGIVLDRSEAGIAGKAKRILKEWADADRINTMFEGGDEQAICLHIFKLRVEGQSAEEILERVNRKYPKVQLSDINEITREYSKEAWLEIAKAAGIDNPKRLKDIRQFLRLAKVYGKGINQFNKAKVLEILQDG